MIPSDSTQPTKPKKQQPRIYCRYCGARLRRDQFGKKCPTHNCQWQHGMKKEDEYL